MDKNYQSNKNLYTDFLKKWINYIISKKGWEKYEDLHVSEVDEKFKKKELMVDAGLFLYDCLLEIIDKEKYQCVLSISVSCKDGKKDLSQADLKCLSQEVDELNPPSLYLFPKTDQYHQDMKNKTQPLEGLSAETGYKARFYEEVDEGYCNKFVYISNI